MPTNLIILLKPLKICSISGQDYSGLALVLLCFFILATVQFLPVLEVMWYFSPFMFSAGMCFTAICHFMLSQNHQEREPPLAEGVKENHRQAVWVNDRAECCIDIDDVEVGCFQMVDLRGKTEGWCEEDEGNDLVEKLASLEGKPEKGKDHNGGLEDFLSLQVDRLAEGLWNSYFGRYSTWHYKGADVQGL